MCIDATVLWRDPRDGYDGGRFERLDRHLAQRLQRMRRCTTQLSILPRQIIVGGSSCLVMGSLGCVLLVRAQRHGHSKVPKVGDFNMKRR